MLAGCGDSARQGPAEIPIHHGIRSGRPGGSAENAYASWVVRDRPWELEDELIAAVDVPLNLQGNPHNRFHSVVTEVRQMRRPGQGPASGAQSRHRGRAPRLAFGAMTASVTATAAANAKRQRSAAHTNAGSSHGDLGIRPA